MMVVLREFTPLAKNSLFLCPAVKLMENLSLLRTRWMVFLCAFFYKSAVFQNRKAFLVTVTSFQV